MRKGMCHVGKSRTGTSRKQGRGRERRERIRRVRSGETESLQAVGGRGQPAFLHQAAEAT